MYMQLQLEVRIAESLLLEEELQARLEEGVLSDVSTITAHMQECSDLSICISKLKSSIDDSSAALMKAQVCTRIRGILKYVYAYTYRILTHQCTNSCVNQCVYTCMYESMKVYVYIMYVYMCVCIDVCQYTPTSFFWKPVSSAFSVSFRPSTPSAQAMLVRCAYEA